MNLRTVNATRYVTPLREGGSLPAVIEADDNGTYVLKFRGAGQGPKALIAELVAGEIARACALPMPELVFVELDDVLARTEPDPEIQDLIRASGGLNLAIDYLPGATTFDPLAWQPDAALASRIVWFDAFMTNVDRTARNTNMMVWQHKLWLIDHGAALYFHHAWDNSIARAQSPFALIKDHVLLPFASELEAADRELAPRVTPELIRAVTDLIPQVWLCDDHAFSDREAHRAAYAEYLMRRIAAPRAFVTEAVRARSTLV
jgi:hypothetical protein